MQTGRQFLNETDARHCSLNEGLDTEHFGDFSFKHSLKEIVELKCEAYCA